MLNENQDVCMQMCKTTQDAKINSIEMHIERIKKINFHFTHRALDSLMLHVPWFNDVLHFFYVSLFLHLFFRKKVIRRCVSVQRKREFAYAWHIY